MRPPFHLWLGWDATEIRAWNVAECSAMLSAGVIVHRLALHEMVARGLYTRPTKELVHGFFDEISQAPMATGHAIARFLVPYLSGYQGWALFTDGDVLFRADLAELFALADPTKAVLVVPHDYQPSAAQKMEGQEQTRYPRKNWSSVMLFNCAHPANRALDICLVNTVPGRDLHRFCWLADDLIGVLPDRWNWLVGHSSPEIDPAIVHFTTGVPDMPGYEHVAFSDEWYVMAAACGYRLERPETGGMTVLAAPLTVEVLSFPGQSSRATEWLRVFATRPGAAVDCVATTRYHGGADVVLLWGAGAPDRAAILQQQLVAGGHVVALDLAYWHREAKARITIDAPHPQAWVMRQAWPTTRLDANRITLGDRWDPEGPIILAGLGRKAKVQYGAQVVDQWEAAMQAACQARWPERPVRYRRKRPTNPVPAWAAARATTHVIDAVLTGASLVITWHSNVAIDAIRLGIPVVCRDGAAAAVCPATLPTVVQPLPEPIRRQFLANLAWFQWAPQEARPMWQFVAELLR